MSLARYTASGILSHALPLLAGLASVPFYIYLLGAPRYGLFILVLAVANYACFLDLGFGKAAAYFLARLGPDARPATRQRYYVPALGLCASVSIAIAAIGLATAPWLTDLLPAIEGASRQELVRSVVFGMAMVPALAAITFLTGVYQGLHLFHRLSAIVATSGIAIQILPLIACVVLGARLDVAIATVAIIRIVTVIMMMLMVRRNLPFRGTHGSALQPLRAMLVFGRWPALLSLLGAVLATGDRLLITGALGPVALAAYSIPFDLANRLMIVSGNVANTIFPMLAQGADEAAGRVQRTRDALLGLLTPLVVGIILLLYPFLHLWVGAEIARQSRMVGEIIICGVWLSAVASLSLSRLLAEERGWQVTLNYALQLLPFFVCTYWAARGFGLIGCALVWSLRCAVDAGVLIGLARDGRGIVGSLARHGVLLAAALGIAAITTEPIQRGLALVVILPISLFISRRQIRVVVMRLFG